MIWNRIRIEDVFSQCASTCPAGDTRCELACYRHSSGFNSRVRPIIMSECPARMLWDKFLGRQEGTTVPSIISDRWWYLQIVALKCHRGWALIKSKGGTVCGLLGQAGSHLRLHTVSSQRTEYRTGPLKKFRKCHSHTHMPTLLRNKNITPNNWLVAIRRSRSTYKADFLAPEEMLQ